MEVPKLAGWRTFPEAAEVLGVTKQAVHAMAFPKDVNGAQVAGEFPSLCSVGSKPVYLISEEDLEDKRQAREQWLLERKERREDKEEHKAEIAQRRLDRQLALAAKS